MNHSNKKIKPSISAFNRLIFACAWKGFSLAMFLGWVVSVSALTALTPLPALHLVNSSPAFPGGQYDAANLVDGNVKTEYASSNQGTNTTVEFDFGAPTRIVAFRHIDRNDVATIAASELEFYDGNGQLITVVPVTHVNQKNGETLLVLPSAVTAQRVKWRVTKLGDESCPAVGGAELSFLTSGTNDATPKRDRIEAQVFPCLERQGGQPVKITIHHPYAESAAAQLLVTGLKPQSLQLNPGINTFELNLPATRLTTSIKVDLQFAGQTVVASQFEQKPVRPLTVYMLPHSHTDIGYAENQSIETQKQVDNLVAGMAAAQRTASYPEGARFVWNVEVAWAADMYLHRMDGQQRADFLTAVRKGQVELNGAYANELTGLCRPEELVQLFRFATEISKQTGVPIRSAMISDVPGYTWGTVTAMAQAGIKYFSAAPNYFDRMGTILRDCENKPFYWIGPDGKSKVLAWIPFKGYAMSCIYQRMSMKLVGDLDDELDRVKYPYDITYVRWAGPNDNAAPDPAICDFVRDWNAKYVWPHFIISGTTEAFAAFERRYGSKLPRYQGDWTPYWEDGAGSSARETAMNRNSSDRLAQADALWTMLDSKNYPVPAFHNAWQNVLLYSEHTWGAWCSVTQPESQATKEQWAVKKAYAEDADKQSRELIAQALETKSELSGGENGQKNQVDVFNTLSWARSGLVTVSRALSAAGDLVKDDQGHPLPSQRLSSGELVFLAKAVPPFAAKRYTISAGAPYENEKPASIHGAILDNGIVHIQVDEKTGGVVELMDKDTEGNLVDTSGGEELNDYLYLRGDNLKNLQGNGAVKLTIGEKGPLVASLVVESDAPGCNKLRREVRVVAGQDYVELLDLVDKARLPATDYKASKESVNFAFPFNVPDGDVLLDIPLGGAMRPEVDQIPGSCKNWFTVGRWVDVSNQKQGVTWVTLDAPLVEVGGITARLLNSQTNPEIWRQKVSRTQKFYSWVMNNHWGTNYRAYQEGLVLFRYILRPHRQHDPAEATRFATGFSQPFLVGQAEDRKHLSTPLLKLSSKDVIVSDLKPSDDGKAWIVRLFGASGKDQSVKLQWGKRAPKVVFLSDTSEKAGETINGNSVSIPGFGLVTLRAEFK